MRDLLSNSGLEKAEYYPTLFIGLGGSGMRAIRSILLYGQSGEDGRAPFDPALKRSLDSGLISTLGIDTDQAEFDAKPVDRKIYPRTMEPFFESGRLPKRYPKLHDRVLIRRNSINAAVQQARRLSRRKLAAGEVRTDEIRHGELVAGFLSIDRALYDRLLPPGDDAEDGAGQLRALGRIAFLCSQQQIANSVEAAIARIRPNLGDHRLRVAIVCSLAGGTGSGMFFDVATLIRKVIASDAIISGHFLLPEVFAAVSTPERIWPNTYAALSELAQLSRPQNVRPVRINYRANDIDNIVTIAAGDAPIFNDVYLYDESAGKAARDNGGGLPPEHSIEVANRAIADTVLALHRYDMVSRNPDSQNLLVGRKNNTDVSRRLFHEAMATHWLPRPTSDLSAILAKRVGDAVFLAPLAKARNDNAAFGGEDIGALTALVKALTDAPQTPLTWEACDLNLRTWTEPLEFGPEVDRPRGDAPADDKDNGNTKVRADWRYHADEIGHRTFSENAFRKHLKKAHLSEFARRSYDALAYDDFNENITVTLNVAAYFRDRMWTKFRPLHHVISKLKPLLTGVSCPDSTQVEALLQLAKQLEDLAKDQSDANGAEGKFSVPVSDIIRRNKSTLAQTYGSDAESGKAGRLLRFPGQHGPLGDEFIALSEELESTLRDQIKEREASDTRATVCENRVARRFLKEDEPRKMVADFRRIVNELETRFNVYKSREDKVAERFPANPRTERRREKNFDEVLGPVDKIAADMALLDNQYDEDPAVTEPIKRRQNTLQIRWARAFKDLYPERQIDPDFKKLLIAIHDKAKEHESPDRPKLAKIMADAIADVALPFVKDAITVKQNAEQDGPRRRFAEHIEDVDAFCREFIEVLMTLPEFEYAKFGGKQGIAALAKRAESRVFLQGSAPGALHVDVALLALPDIGDEERDPEGVRPAKDQIVSEISSVLRARPRITSDKSEMPVLLSMGRYNAAFQLRNIERYAQGYMDADDDEFRLFHVVPEAADFPPLTSRDAFGFGPERWDCREHGSMAYPVNARNTHCPECVREYERGERHLRDITRRDADVEHPTLNADGDLDWKDTLPTERHVHSFYCGVHESEDDDFKQQLLKKNDGVKGLKIWNPNKPPHLTYPMAPNPDGKGADWVVREPNNPKGVFKRADKTLAYECGHCAFPIISDLISESGKKATCPRCRRVLESCHVCSEPNHRYVEMRTDPNEPATVICPRCKAKRAMET